MAGSGHRARTADRGEVGPAAGAFNPRHDRCIDGAIGSATNADLALAVPARTVVVVTGVGARPEPGTPEPLWAAALDREFAAVEASGRRVIVLRPSAADRAAMGADPMSGAGAPAAVAAGIAAGRRVAPPARAAA